MLLRAPDHLGAGNSGIPEAQVQHGQINLNTMIQMLTIDGVLIAGDPETYAEIGNCEPEAVEKILSAHGLRRGRGDRHNIWATKESHRAGVTPDEVVKSLGDRYDGLQSLFHRSGETLFQKPSGVHMWRGRSDE